MVSPINPRFPATIYSTKNVMKMISKEPYFLQFLIQEFPFQILTKHIKLNLKLNVCDFFTKEILKFRIKLIK